MTKKVQYGSRLFTVAIAGLLFFCLMAVTGVKAKANSNSNPSWSTWTTSGSQEYYFTDWIEKTNSSKVYVYWETSSGPRAIYVTAQGKNGSTNGAGYSTGAKYITQTGQYSITNLIYENLHTATYPTVYARIGVRSAAGEGNVSGKWNPDSTINYTVLN